MLKYAMHLHWLIDSRLTEPTELCWIATHAEYFLNAKGHWELKGK